MVSKDMFTFLFIRNHIPTTIQVCQEDIYCLLVLPAQCMGIQTLIQEGFNRQHAVIPEAQSQTYQSLQKMQL